MSAQADNRLTSSPPPPSWIEKEAQDITGLDLLGLRAPVNAIGNILIDGVTTISPMVRYVSLRAWITHIYGQLALPDSSRDFIEFATRVESAVVIGNLIHNSNTSGLIGSDAASKIVAEAGKQIELQRLVKQPATNIYLGPSLQVGIAFDRDEGIAGLTEERGLPLALAANEILGKTRFGEELLRTPTLKRFTRDELARLGAAFPIGAPSEKERQVLLSAILPAKPRSESEFNRVASYGILLEIANNSDGLNEFDILNHAIDPDCPLLPKYTKWLNGWACYFVRDMLAVAHEAALAAMLYALQDEGGDERPVAGHALICAMLRDDAELKVALKDLGLLPVGRKPLDAPLHELARLLDERTSMKHKGQMPRWDGLSEQDVIDVAYEGGIKALAMLPVSWLLSQARVTKGEENQGLLSDFLSPQGWARIGIEQVVLPDIADMLRRKITIREAVAELAMRTMDQHVRIAWARLAADPNRDVALLTVDNGMWTLRNGKEFRPGRTASRLIQAIGWLRQLGLLQDAGCTKEGKRHLEEIRNHVVEQEGTA